MYRRHWYGVTCSKELCHVKRDVGVAEVADYVFTISEQLFHRKVVRLNACLRLPPLGRINRVGTPS